MSPGTLIPAHSSERLIDGGPTTPGGLVDSKSDFAYYSELLPPELAREIMMGRYFLDVLVDCSVRQMSKMLAIRLRERATVISSLLEAQ